MQAEDGSQLRVRLAIGGEAKCTQLALLRATTLMTPLFRNAELRLHQGLCRVRVANMMKVRVRIRGRVRSRRTGRGRDAGAVHAVGGLDCGEFHAGKRIESHPHDFRIHHAEGLDIPT